MSVVDPNIKEWATDKQAEKIDAVNKYGSYHAAARAMRLDVETVRQGVIGAQKRAAQAGYSPDHEMTKTVPEPFIVKGISTLYDKDGQVSQQWVKSTLDQQKAQEAMLAAVKALAEDVKRAKPAKAPKQTQDHLCTLYTFTDCHVGMRAWKPETGADWDLHIAERVLCGAFDHLVASSPKASTAIINQLGDFLHYDSLTPVTPTSGHILDADGRYSKVIQVAVRILRYVVDQALLHHERVVVVMAEGNHDMSSAVWLRYLFSLLYENEPRVTVIQSEMPYYTHEHGKTMLAFHHGHMKKNTELPGLFAAQYPELWGRTKYRYAHTGHRHHVEEKELSGMTVTQHTTMAARDAYAARGGWLSDRAISSITYHQDYGQVARNTVTPEMLETV